MRLPWLLLLFHLFGFDVQAQSRCYHNAFGNRTLCVNVTSTACFDVAVSLTLDNTRETGSMELYEAELPIPQLLQSLQARLDEEEKAKVEVCQPLSLTDITGTPLCSVCSVVGEEARISNGKIHLCSNITINCTDTDDRTFELPCIDIDDCKLFECPTTDVNEQCYGVGTCTELGICRCNPGFYGPDCSITVGSNSTNCIYSSYWPHTCWTVKFPDCHNIDWKVVVQPNTVVSTTQAKLDSELTMLPLIPCRQMPGNSMCDICVHAVSLTIQDDKFIGCPVVDIVCANVTVDRYSMECAVLATDVTLKCSKTTGRSGQPTPLAASSDATLIALAVVLAVSLIGIAGYLLLRRYGYIHGIPADAEGREGHSFQQLSSEPDDFGDYSDEDDQEILAQLEAENRDSDDFDQAYNDDDI